LVCGNTISHDRPPAHDDSIPFLISPVTHAPSFAAEFHQPELLPRPLWGRVRLRRESKSIRLLLIRMPCPPSDEPKSEARNCARSPRPRRFLLYQEPQVSRQAAVIDFLSAPGHALLCARKIPSPACASGGESTCSATWDGASANLSARKNGVPHKPRSLAAATAWFAPWPYADVRQVAGQVAPTYGDRARHATSNKVSFQLISQITR